MRPSPATQAVGRGCGITTGARRATGARGGVGGFGSASASTAAGDRIWETAAKGEAGRLTGEPTGSAVADDASDAVDSSSSSSNAFANAVLRIESWTASAALGVTSAGASAVGACRISNGGVSWRLTGESSS